MRFEDKTGERFRRYVQALASLYDGPVYVWTHLTPICGLLALPSIRAFNFGFCFDVDPKEIIGLTSVDSRDKLLMDYTREDSEEMLEVEVLGERWGQAQY